MAQNPVIAVDAMGGDHGPAVIIAGVDLSRIRHTSVRFLLFGDEGVLRNELAARPALARVSEVRHAPQAVPMDAKPSQALRSGRESSLWRAIGAVANGEAQGVISAGNTGALMAMAKIQLRTLAGVDRPAIAALWPTMRGTSVVLDVGANVECDGAQLAGFAIMGAAFARVVFGLDRPTVGLLNIGTEDVKGNEAVKDAAQRLRDAEPSFEFHGFVEGDDISAGTVDVVVTDGFTGNVALKTAEGTAKLVGSYLSRALRRSLLSRLGALLASGAFRVLRQKMDPRAVNGGVFLGLNGVVVKSHGSSDAMGFASALDLTIDIAAGAVPTKIADDVARFGAVVLAGEQKSEVAAS